MYIINEVPEGYNLPEGDDMIWHLGSTFKQINLKLLNNKKEFMKFLCN